MTVRILAIIHFLLLLFSFRASATHIIGGELSYRCLGGDQYEITLNIYRDCQPFYDSDGNLITPVGFDNIFGDPVITPGAPDALISIYNSSDELVDQIYFTSLTINSVEDQSSNECLFLPPDLCVEQGVYQVTTELPPIAGGYQIAYQRCCRNPSVINIVDPGETGITVACQIPEPTDAVCNNSPEFAFYPPLAICLGDELSINQSAFDIDGDDLVYSFTTPFLGASLIDSDETTPPPFTEVAWENPFEALAPLPASPGLAIDPVTGIITGTPTAMGQYIIGIKVEEFRDGVKLGEIIRDFRFLVLECDATISSFPLVDQVCEGLTVDFTNESSHADQFQWDFGDPTTTTDISTEENPTYTYPSSGTYTVSLIANPGTVCADTSSVTFDLVAEIFPEIPEVAFQCFEGNSFQFEAAGSYEDGSTFSWDFGPSASPRYATSPFPENIQFSTGGIHTVELTVTFKDCIETVYQEVEVGHKILYDMTANPIGCALHTVNFAPVTAGGIYEYLWDFGNGETSTEMQPEVVYDTGVYSVTLQVTDVETGCVESISKPDWIEVYPEPIAGMLVSPTEIFLGQKISIYDQSQYANIFAIDFGNGFISDEAEPTYEYPAAGEYTILQTVSNESGCIDTLSQKVSVLHEYSVYVPNVFSPNGDGLNDTFRPSYRGISDYEMEIYNRWGENVFVKKLGQNIEWDGIMPEGRDANEEVFIYLAKFLTFSGKIIEKEGHVTLVR